MQHNSIDKLIDKFLFETLSLEEEVALKRLLNEDSKNLEYFNQVVNVWMESRPTFDSNTINVQKAKTEILEKIAPKRLAKRKSIVWLQRIAAVILLPLSLFFLYNLIESKTESNIIAYKTVSAPFGTRIKVNLPDKSLVWLNSGSQIKYPTHFVKGKRVVFLEGEGYFEVKSDKKNPFTVETKTLNVTATGTIFNVEAYSSDSMVNVILARGKVDVEINKSHQLVNMVPNKRVSYNINSGVVETKETDAYKFCSWKDGSLVFENDRLDIILKKIGYLRNIEFDIADKNIASQHIKATFSNKSVTQIMNLLNMTTPFKYRTIHENDSIHKTKIVVY
jgi:ferric-dicitrate binding protein FerR (iron transport regulator)